jgi:hypothetical protein
MEKKQLDDTLKQEFAKILGEFKQRFGSERGAPVVGATR